MSPADAFIGDGEIGTADNVGAGEDWEWCEGCVFFEIGV